MIHKNNKTIGETTTAVTQCTGLSFREGDGFEFCELCAFCCTFTMDGRNIFFRKTEKYLIQKTNMFR